MTRANVRKALGWLGLAILSGLIGAAVQGMASQAADAAQKLWLKHYIQGTVAKHHYWDLYQRGAADKVRDLHGQQDYWQNLAKYRGDAADRLMQRLKALDAVPTEAK